jgi:hypothetical protein
MYKEMHIVIDVEIKTVVYFVSDVISLNNDLITGHNSIISIKGCYQQCMKNALKSHILQRNHGLLQKKKKMFIE